MSKSRRASRGQVTAEAALGLVVAVLGLAGLQPLGHGFAAAIRGDGAVAPVALASVPVTSSQAAILEPSVLRAMGDAARVVPEWAPASLVEVHTLAVEMVPGLKGALMDAFGHRAVRTTEGATPRGYTDRNLAWLRDYAPSYVRGENGQVNARRFLSTEESRAAVVNAEVRIPLDANAVNHQQRIVRFDLETVPLLHENGNLVSTGDRLLVTDLLGKVNATSWDLPHLRRANFVTEADHETTYARFAAALGHDRRSLIVLPSMPGERTGHVDTFVLALGPGEVMVPTIEDALLGQLDYAHERWVGGETQRFLHAQAARLESEGLTVHRLPMPAPTHLVADERSPLGWYARFYSPANSLAVDLEGNRHAFVPTVDKALFPEGAHRDLLTSYDEQLSAFFERRGFTPHLLDATELGSHNGLLRCVSRVCPAVVLSP